MPSPRHIVRAETLVVRAAPRVYVFWTAFIVANVVWFWYLGETHLASFAVLTIPTRASCSDRAAR